jgi:alpha-tubulin suppressor-like RCC1 family protein
LASIKEKNLSIVPIQLALPNHSPVKQLKCKGNQTFVILEDGSLLGYFKPIQGNNSEATDDEEHNDENSSLLCFSPEISLGNQVQAHMIACSIHFCLILSRTGLVYSMGSSNTEGELGHGDMIARPVPTLIDALLEQKTISIACGFRHSLTCNNKGHVFTWGWGGFGQLGLGEKKNELLPRKVSLEALEKARHKVVQVEATFKSSLALTDNHKIMWWGTNSTLQLRCRPSELDLGSKVKLHR